MTFFSSLSPPINQSINQKLQYHLGDLEALLSGVVFVELQALHNPANVAHNIGVKLVPILSLGKGVILVCSQLS